MRRGSDFENGRRVFWLVATERDELLKRLQELTEKSHALIEQNEELVREYEHIRERLKQLPDGPSHKDIPAK